jgi:hypothetical protein
VLRADRQRIAEIKTVFSGGQQLTTAIILYCTMAALRANNRGRAAGRHSGVAGAGWMVVISAYRKTPPKAVSVASTAYPARRSGADRDAAVK